MEKTDVDLSRIKFVQCLLPQKVELNEVCLACRDSDRCLTIRPKLAAAVGKFMKRVCLPNTEEIASLKENYPEVFKFDNRRSMAKLRAPGSVRVANCISAGPMMSEETCMQCRLNNCCLLINPELASLVEKRKVNDGMYEFAQKDITFLDTKYPSTVLVDSDGSYLFGESMAQYLIDYYQSSNILQMIVDKEIISRLITDRYTEEEIEFLYIGINNKWEKMEEVFKEMLPPKSLF